MFKPLSWRCCTTQSMPAITCDTSVEPSAAPTFTFTIRASGATPTNRDGSVRSRARIPPGDDARHVRAVPVGVDRLGQTVLVVEREVGTVHDLVRQARHRRDAGVEQRDVDTVTGVAAPPTTPARQWPWSHFDIEPKSPVAS